MTRPHAAHERNRRPRSIGAKGCVGVMGAFLGSDDYELQCLAAETVCHMAVSEDLKVPIVQEGVLPALIALGAALDTEVIEHVARTVAELADNDHNEIALVESILQSRSTADELSATSTAPPCDSESSPV